MDDPSYGYEIRYSTSSSMSSAKVVELDESADGILKVNDLKSKKKYYVQTRTYIAMDDIRYYGRWSDKKSVTVK